MSESAKIRGRRAKSGFSYYLDKQPLQGTAKGAPIVLRKKKSRKELVRLKIAYLTERLGGVTHFADAVQADKSRVSRWTKGATPDERNSSTINDLEYICQRLSSFLNDASANQWLESPNAFLKGTRPIDALHQGRMVDVLSAANQEEAGSYA